jgi:hypothetical protein
MPDVGVGFGGGGGTIRTRKMINNDGIHKV